MFKLVKVAGGWIIRSGGKLFKVGGRVGAIGTASKQWISRYTPNFLKAMVKTSAWKTGSEIARELVGFAVTSAVLDKVLGKSPDQSKKEGELSDEETAMGLKVLEATGHAKLNRMYGLLYGPAHWSSEFTRSIDNIIQRIMWSKRAITGELLSQEDTLNIESYTQNEIDFVLTRLISTAKEIALLSSHNEYNLLYMRQLACSNMVNSSPTNAREIINSRGLQNTERVMHMAQAHNLLYEGLYKETTDQYADELFNKSTTSWDFFDAFGGGAEKWTDDTEALRETKDGALISMMASDDTSASQLGWYDKWRADSDGDDDESAAVRALVYYSAVGDNYGKTISAVIQEQDQNAQRLLRNY